MAASNLNLGKASGGVLNIQPADGTTNTSLVLPASGTVVATDVAVTDNAIARYDGTTGKVQNSGVTIDDSNNIMVSGNLGIGTGVISPYLADVFSLNGKLQPHYGFNLRCTAYEPIGISGYYGISFAASGAQKMILDGYGNLLLTSGTGGLGYGTGAGGTVTQLTSKSTAVVLNKPSGRITTHNAALAAGTIVEFAVINSLVAIGDTVTATLTNVAYGSSYTGQDYDVDAINWTANGVFYIELKNKSAVSKSDSVVIDFVITKGAKA